MVDNDKNLVDNYYNSLRSLDGRRVKMVVDKLKDSGFDVYATGSSLDRTDYRDIDLVVTTPDSSDDNTSIGLLEKVLGDISGIKVMSEDDKTFIELGQYLKFKSEELTYSGSPIIQKEEVEFVDRFPLTTRAQYSSSDILTRKNLQYRQELIGLNMPTNIDIVLTPTPFSAIPQTKRIKL